MRLREEREGSRESKLWRGGGRQQRGDRRRKRVLQRLRRTWSLVIVSPALLALRERWPLATFTYGVTLSSVANCSGMSFSSPIGSTFFRAAIAPDLRGGSCSSCADEQFNALEGL